MHAAAGSGLLVSSEEVCVTEEGSEKSAKRCHFSRDRRAYKVEEIRYMSRSSRKATHTTIEARTAQCLAFLATGPGTSSTSSSSVSPSEISMTVFEGAGAGAAAGAAAVVAAAGRGRGCGLELLEAVDDDEALAKHAAIDDDELAVAAAPEPLPPRFRLMELAARISAWQSFVSGAFG